MQRVGEGATRPRLASAPRPHHCLSHPHPHTPQLERIERLGDEAWAGVAAVDRGGQPPPPSRSLLLALGDTAALTAFAAAGRSNHSEGLALASVAATAAPFVAAWLGAAGVTGGFSATARAARGTAAATTALRAWLPFFPVAHALRAATLGRAPDPAFVGVSAAVTIVLLVGWRVAVGATAPAADAARGNKRGSVFEFFSLLKSLTTRW